jgi:hypothetical protein
MASLLVAMGRERHTRDSFIPASFELALRIATIMELGGSWTPSHGRLEFMEGQPRSHGNSYRHDDLGSRRIRTPHNSSLEQLLHPWTEMAESPWLRRLQRCQCFMGIV